MSYRARDFCKIHILPYTLLQRLFYQHESFKKKLIKNQMNILLKEKKFPLDYTHELQLQHVRRSQDRMEVQNMLTRRNSLKNVVMRVIMANRSQKRKPNLSMLLNHYRQDESPYA